MVGQCGYSGSIWPGNGERYGIFRPICYGKQRGVEQLAWSSDQMKVLRQQWETTFGVPEIAGGYYTGRHLTNAVRKVINDNDDPRETLLDYTRTINEEIDKKRLEFGLDTQ